MSYNMTNVLGILFANTHDSSLPELSSMRAMASVPFGGRFRLIDFQLSAMVNSGITKVGVITKSNYQSLLDHLGSGRHWDLARNDGGLTILPPYARADAGMYRGKLDALFNVLGYIEKQTCEYVVIGECNTVYSPDYAKIIKAHVKSGADITCVVSTGEYTKEETADSIVFNVDANLRVNEALINCAKAGKHTLGLGITVMSKELLVKLVTELIPKGKFSLYEDVLQAGNKELDIRAFEYEGYFSRITSLAGYYEASMKLLDPANLRSLILKKKPVYTKVRDDAPTKYGLDSAVSNSMVADGCIIEGTVENSILFRGVKVAKGAVIKNSILMQDTTVGKNTQVLNIITDKEVTIGDNLCVSSAEGSPLYIAKRRVL